MPAQTFIKLLPFLKEVFGLMDDKPERTTDEKLLLYAVIFSVVVTVIALLFAEQSYMQAIDKYETQQHVQYLEDLMAQCRADRDLYSSIISKREVDK